MGIFISLLVSLGAFAHAKKISHDNEFNRVTSVRNIAIDSIDMDWWDDGKNLLFIDITFNFPVSITSQISDQAKKTHIIQMVATGTAVKNFKQIYSGNEHHAIPKAFRDVIEEIRYEGGGQGKAQILVYLYEPAIVTYQAYNDFRTIHLEVSRIQK